MNWFVVVAAGILLVLFLFLGFRITGIGNASWYAAGALTGLVFFYPLVWYGVLDDPWDQIVRAVIHIDLGMLSLMIALIIMRDLLFLPLRFFRDDLFGFAFSSYATFAMAAISMLLLIFGFWNAQRGPQVLRTEIPIAGLSSDLEDYTIIQLSDLHAGAGISREYVDNVVDQVLQLKADAIVLTGDIADGDFEKYKSRIDSLTKLTAELPVLYVTGNHEYIKDGPKWLGQFQRLGVRVLMNEHTQFQKGNSSVLFVGVIDPEVAEYDPTQGPDLENALAGHPESSIKILLAHQPNIASEASKNFDLQLSGHTHAGQFFPWSVVIKLVQPFAIGLKPSDKMWVYTNSGTGFWGPPFRIGTRSEISLLVLKRAKKTS